MANYFSQYSGIAGSYADQYNLPRSVVYGLFDQESGWNPNAIGDSGLAIGLGQLHAGAASDVGVNRFDPIQNIKGSVAYLAQQVNHFNGDITKGLAAYNQGAGNWQKGLGYAQSVLDKAKKYLTGQNISDVARTALGDPTALFDLGGNILGNGDSCGINPICYLRQWIEQSSFFTRLALATLALLFILGGLYLMKGNN